MISNVVMRIGTIFRVLVSLSVETLAIGTEAAKLAAEHLDHFVDELGKNTEVVIAHGTVSERLGYVARDLSTTVLSLLSIITEVLMLLTKHADGFLDDLNARVTTTPSASTSTPPLPPPPNP